MKWSRHGGSCSNCRNRWSSPKRFLLSSATLGEFGVIDELAAQVQADAVIHAGDFDFFDDGSFYQLSDRELRLHIVHSDLPRAEKDRILVISRNDMIGAARARRLLGAFPYQWGIKDQAVPGEVEATSRHISLGFCKASRPIEGAGTIPLRLVTAHNFP